MRPPPSLRQRGMAIIAALLVVVAASALATSIIERQGLLAHILMSEGDRVQAAWMLRGGLDVSRLVLQMDADNGPTTRADGMWTRPLVGLPVGSADNPERARLSGQIEDEQGKYNLRNLAEKGRTIPQEVEALEGLLESLGIDSSLAIAMAQRVADAQSGAGTVPRAVGLRGIEDLRVLTGFTPEVLQAMQPYVTVLPVPTPINANTASAEVLGAVVEDLDLAGARELILRRDEGLWFVNRADFVNRIHSDKPEAGQRISVDSNWFRVTGEVAVDDTMVGLRALLHRSERGLTSIRWVIY